jgi:hypothetical protein
MDMSLITAALGLQNGKAQMDIATTILKSNADMEKATVATLLGGAQNSLANVAAGVGGSLDISA